MDRLEILQNKVNLILNNYSVKAESLKRALQENERLRLENETLQKKLQTTEEQMLAVSIANAIPDGEVQDKSRKLIDGVISEIDKILTSLND